MEKFEGQLLPACVDPSHILTNMRVKVARDGILGVDKNALCIANRYPDVLNHTLVTDFLDKRNVAFAYRVFSQLVAEKMAENGKTILQVDLCPSCITGIAVVELVKHLLPMKEYLSNGISPYIRPVSYRHIESYALFQTNTRW